MKRNIDIVLDAEKELLLRIIDDPKEMDKLPKKSLFLPREKIIIPFKEIKTINDILIFPKLSGISKLKKKILL